MVILYVNAIIDAAFKEAWGEDKSDDRTGLEFTDCFKEDIGPDYIHFSLDLSIPTEFFRGDLFATYSDEIKKRIRYFINNECIFEEVPVDWESLKISDRIVDGSYILTIECFSTADYVDQKQDEINEVREESHLESKRDFCSYDCSRFN